MEKPIFNIEPYIHNVEELNFSEFYKKRLENPYFFRSQFEEKLKEKLRTKKEICSLNSGTSALHMALRLSNIKPNEVVFCSNASFIASVNPILYENAKPYLIDVDIKTGNLNTEYLENAILNCLSNNEIPKAIIVTHSYGVPADMKELMRIKTKYNLILIEDAAEALGAAYNNDSCGTIGDFGIISFNSNKICTTLGGGALIVNNLDEKREVLFQASQSKNKGIEYLHKSKGYNYVMNDMSAYLGIHQLNFLKTELEVKEKLFLGYKELINDIDNVSLLFSEGDSFIKTNKWLNCISFSNEELKLRAIENFKKEKIEVRGFWYPLSSQSFLKHYPCQGNGETQELHSRTLCLPSSINLQKKQRNKIINILKKTE